MSWLRAKTLGDPAVRALRLGMLGQPDIAPLAAFLERIRRVRGLSHGVPFFDPLDGGVGARYLVVHESPGPQAAKSGFISRDNPDESAKNTLLLHGEAALDRHLVAICNIVPWYIGDGERIRPATSSDIAAGLPYLLELVGMLPRLEAVLLSGLKAQRAARELRSRFPKLTFFDAPHPSPMYVNKRPANRGFPVERLRWVSALLNGGEPPLNSPNVAESVAREIPQRPRASAPAGSTSMYASKRILRARASIRMRQPSASRLPRLQRIRAHSAR
jgi:hypothetical protein